MPEFENLDSEEDRCQDEILKYWLWNFANVTQAVEL